MDSSYINYITLPAKPGIQSSVCGLVYSAEAFCWEHAKTVKINKLELTVDYFHSFKPDLDRSPPPYKEFYLQNVIIRGQQHSSWHICLIVNSFGNTKTVIFILR